MALVIKDRVKETTTTTSTGTYTLAGAVSGFKSFDSVMTNNGSDTTYYCCTDGTNFEVGIGTYTSSGTTLARTTILQSSNSDSAVNWSAGTRTIFCTYPADKAVFKDASDDDKAGLRDQLKNLRKDWFEGMKGNREEVRTRIKEIRDEFKNKRDEVIDGNDPGE